MGTAPICDLGESQRESQTRKVDSERHLTDLILSEPFGLFMRPDFKVVAARDVKKELTPSYERKYSRKNAVYDDINQREACEGGYGEGKFGIETRKQSHGGEMNFSLPVPPLSQPASNALRDGEKERKRSHSPGWGRLESSLSLQWDH